MRNDEAFVVAAEGVSATLHWVLILFALGDRINKVIKK